MEPSASINIPLEPRPAGCPIPLTAFQHRLWDSISKQDKPLSIRLCAESARVFGPLNVDLLQKSIEVVVLRHESLRTRFVIVDGVPRQHVEPAGDYHLNVVDLAAVSSVKVESEAKRVAQEFIEEHVDLSTGPLFDARLLKLNECEHVLILVVDHMVSDTISWSILSKEIWTSYDQALQGRPFFLPTLPVQFADYAVWQQRTHSAWLEKHEAYWRGRLAGARRTQLRCSERFPETQDPIGVTMLHFSFGKILTTKLRDVARRERTLLSMVFLTIYVAVMSRWCNQDDLIMQFVSHGRHGHSELENMIGFIANHLHFRVEITKGDTFVDLLKRASGEFYSAYQHQDFDRVPDLIPECATDLYFNWRSTKLKPPPVRHQGEAARSLRIQPFPLKAPASSNLFTPLFSDTPAGVGVMLVYRHDLVARSTIERFYHDLRFVAEEFARYPLASIASVYPTT
jgi:Condensation domain